MGDLPNSARVNLPTFCIVCGVDEELHDRPYGDCGTAARKVEVIEAFCRRPSREPSDG